MSFLSLHEIESGVSEEPNNYQRQIVCASSQPGLGMTK